jgi:hypothetical protein
LSPGAFAVISELSWLQDEAPDAVTQFFRVGCAAMQSVPGNVTVAENAGYKVLATQVLPREAWIDGYYEILASRAQALLDHPEAEVREYAAETVREIDVFNHSEDSYGYVFYVLQHG